MSIEHIIESWKEVRLGLIEEANQIPADKFSFQPAADSRSVGQLLQHLVESLMSFAIAHEMYHRGQLTVYERLLGIEPALTQRFRKAFGESPP
jgi:uncharacterized damage-inducible protein DinB